MTDTEQSKGHDHETLAYASPESMDLIRQALLSAADQVQTDVMCQTHSERHGRDRALERIRQIAEGYGARARETETP